jgi:hypothetical protein
MSDNDDLFEIDVTFTIKNGIEDMAGPNMETAIRQVEESLKGMKWPNLFHAEIVEVRRVDDNE